MDRMRLTTVAIAVVLALVATMTVYLYVQGLEKRSELPNLIQVIVSKVDIVAGSELDPLLERDTFTTIGVQEEALVANAVTDLSQLKGKRTSAPILAGEQMTAARFEGSDDLPGGTLGIPEGFEALTVSLESPRAAGGAIRDGDRVRILATLAKQRDAVTVVLVPDVAVLRAGGSEDVSGLNPRDEAMVTLALKPSDTQKVVFALETGQLYLSLLPPGEEGAKGSPVTVSQVSR